MEPEVGIFVSRQSAANAALSLRSRGFAQERVQLLLPPTPHAEDVIPTDDAEQPGMGQAVGGVVGGAMGATAGLGIGAAVASLLIPGVGAVTAIGLAAAALLGAGGAVGGAVLGGTLEEKSREGLPRDEAYLYEDALKHGRTVVFALPETEAQVKIAREVLQAEGAESLDAARDAWWVGIRDAEMAHAGPGFAESEAAYRQGFVSALHPESLGSSYAARQAALRERHGALAESEGFRRGFERGLLHSGRRESPPAAASPSAPSNLNERRSAERRSGSGEASR